MSQLAGIKKGRCFQGGHATIISSANKKKTCHMYRLEIHNQANRIKCSLLNVHSRVTEALAVVNNITVLLVGTFLS